MKNLISIFCIFLFSITAISAQSKDEKAKLAIRKVMDEQTAAWNAGDLEGFMRGYWNSPEMTFVSSGKITKGWQPTLDNYKKTYGSKAQMGVLTFSDLEITILGKDAAAVLGKWSLQREKDNLKGLFTLTFRKFKEGWRIILDHSE
jgi:ketosteroid isomerase-like protein